jgi:glyoxylase-like metal-dependent hydrolase (beta-lactamase superfamily II)
MANFLQKMFTNSAPSQVMPGVYRIQSAFVNAYMVGEYGGPWVLVDTGLPFSTDQIKKAVDDRFGVQSRPEAIVLTHGHFDHSGTVEELSRYWDVPVYAHPLEIPFLTGQSAYPPADPTVGGFGGQLSRFYTNEPVNIAERIHQLPEDGTIPGMKGWKWVHTPGHTPGHISLFREEDALLIAGDALTTLNMRNMQDMMSGKPVLNGPPEYFTPDWAESLRSIDKLVALRPQVLTTGHGEPLYYRGLELDLIDFADRFQPPHHGRYAETPAHFNETGVVSLPPPANDNLPKIVAGAAAGLLATVVTIGVLKNRGKSSDSKEKGKDQHKEKDRYNVLRTRKTVGRSKMVLSDEDRKEVYLQEKRALEREKERAREIEKVRIAEWEAARAKREKEKAKLKEKEKAEATAREKERAKARAKAEDSSSWKDEWAGLFQNVKPNGNVKRKETKRVFGIFKSRASKEKEKTGLARVYSNVKDRIK